jgi:succinylarginine dihydrolase
VNTVELQLDGLVGPTHNYAGLSVGNVASMSNEGSVSHPRAAALQGLDKMAFVASLGVEQAVMPPQERPDINLLRSLGFCGDDEAVLAAAHLEDPVLLAQASSASSMWTANAATVTPSCDSSSSRVQFTPANLRCKLHRSIEPPQAAALLKRIFADSSCFEHHDPVIAADQFGDEGAANHTWLRTADRTVNFFVYGCVSRDPAAPAPQRFPARQTLESSQAIARLHRIDNAFFAQQSPDAIDAGVFHNDVISVGTENLLLVHEQAFLNTAATLKALTDMLGDDLVTCVVPTDALTIPETVMTYLFNSQLLKTPQGMVLVAPSQVREHARARAVVDGWVQSDSPITQAHYIDVQESMHNGGGPACLRLRVPLTRPELEAVHTGIRWSDPLEAALRAWVERWYPESLKPDDLGDPTLARANRDALQALTDLLDLGSVYPFQQ